MVAFGEQTIPSGITALLVAMMPVWVAIFGRVLLGERLPWLAGVGIVVGFVGVAILVGPTILGQTGALDPLGPGRHHHLADRLVPRLAVRVASGDAAAPAARGDRCPDARRRRRPGRHGRPGRRVRSVRPDRRVPRFGRGARLPHGRRQPARLHGLRLVAARRAAPVHRHVCLRQPGRGRDPRRVRAATSPSTRGRWSPAR